MDTDLEIGSYRFSGCEILCVKPFKDSQFLLIGLKVKSTWTFDSGRLIVFNPFLSKIIRAVNISKQPTNILPLFR